MPYAAPTLTAIFQYFVSILWCIFKAAVVQECCVVQGSGGEDGMQLVGEAATQGLSDAINLIPEMQVSTESLCEDALRAFED